MEVLNGALIRPQISRAQPSRDRAELHVSLWRQALEPRHQGREQSGRRGGWGRSCCWPATAKKSPMACQIHDPYVLNPCADSRRYGMDKLINAILLGVLTYDANLLGSSNPAHEPHPSRRRQSRALELRGSRRHPGHRPAIPDGPVCACANAGSTTCAGPTATRAQDVSLLAGRGHRPIPRVTTIQDLKTASIFRAVSGDLDELIGVAAVRHPTCRSTLRRIPPSATLSWRGTCLDMFPAPLLAANSKRDEEKVWSLTPVGPRSQSRNMSRRAPGNPGEVRARFISRAGISTCAAAPSRGSPWPSWPTPATPRRRRGQGAQPFMPRPRPVTAGRLRQPRRNTTRC